MISRDFINRPVFSIVLSLLIVITGLVAIYVVPIARLPEVTPPVIHITAVYPGADTWAVAESVAKPQLPAEAVRLDITVVKASTSILEVVALDSPRRPHRRPEPEQLCDHQPAGPHQAGSGRGRRLGVRQPEPLDANLA